MVGTEPLVVIGAETEILGALGEVIEGITEVGSGKLITGTDGFESGKLIVGTAGVETEIEIVGGAIDGAEFTWIEGV